MATEAEIIASNVLASAIEYKRLYDTTKKNEYKVKEQRLRQIAENVKLIVSSTSSSSVSSFNGRTGAVTLLGSDVTSALGYTPLASESDTLDSVTDRGSTTPNAINVGGITTDYVQFDTIATPTPVVGMMSWDTDRSTVSVQLDSDVDAHLGQDNFWYVKNQTGSTIPKGKAVMAVGTLGASGRILIDEMVADGSISAKYLLGITAESIANGADGFVMNIGKIRQLDTSAWPDGTVLYCDASTPGNLTATAPSSPNLALPVAFVVHSAANGIIAVRIQTLDENAFATPTLQQVTTAGNTTTNSIGIGLTTSPTYKLDVFGTGGNGGVSSNVGFNIQPVDPPNITGMTYTLLPGTALSVGRYWYHIIYYNAIGETSRSTSFQVDTTSGNQIVQLNNIPVSTNPSVIGRNIYRGKVGDSASYGAKIGTITNNVDTTFVDSISDSDPIIPSQVLDRQIFGKPNTTSKYISVFGVRSMIVDSVGLTTFGYQAGEDIISAGNTTLFGYRAGANITTRGGNTLFGYNAGASITTGAQNVGMGDNALVGVTTGSYNVGLGPNVLQRDGSFNIAFGYYTGQATTGNNNVMIGSYIGSSTLSMSDSIIIGHNATPLASTNNQINIGNTIYGRRNTGNVQIGTTTDAGYKLDVNGTTRLNGLTSINSTTVANTALAIGANGTGAGNFIIQGYDAYANNRFYITATGNFRINGPTDTGTSGQDEKFKLILSFAPTSGTREHLGIWLLQTINQTGGANGITRGLYVNPTLTSAYDFRAIETSAGKVIHQGLTAATQTNQVYYNTTTGELTYGALPTVATPTLAQVTTAGNTTTNAVTVGGLTVTGMIEVFKVGSSVEFRSLDSNINFLGKSDNTGGVNFYGGGAYNTGGGISVTGNSNLNPSSIYFFRDAFTQNGRFFSSGNLLLGSGSTDAGYKLDVSGTIRSSGVITASGGTSTDWNAAYSWGNHATAGYLTGTTGYTGIFTVPTNPPGQQNLDIVNGLIVNVF